MKQPAHLVTAPPEHGVARIKASSSGDIRRTARNGPGSQAGILIINADDWGRDRQATDRTLECVQGKAVSSVSAMVFMEDSERAAELARQAGIDAGLHLNLTTAFSAPGCPAAVQQHHQRVAGYLTRHRLAQAVFHPGLAASFEYVVSAQLEQYRRLYGKDPERVDGHHHMHLCANVLWSSLLPAGTIARRNFSFQAGEKSGFNRAYRSVMDRLLARHHRLTDYFFSLPPLEPASRVQHIFSLARRAVVEVETHPVNAAEYRFLAGGEVFAVAGDLPVASRFTVAQPASTPAGSLHLRKANR